MGWIIQKYEAIIDDLKEKGNMIYPPKKRLFLIYFMLLLTEAILSMFCYSFLWAVLIPTFLVWIYLFYQFCGAWKAYGYCKLFTIVPFVALFIFNVIYAHDILLFVLSGLQTAIRSVSLWFLSI